MKAGSIIAHLRLKTKEFQQGLNSARSKLKRTSADFKRVGAGMTAIGGTMATGLGFAVKTTATFEKQMSNVGAVANASDKELARLTETAKNLGASTAFSATEAGQGMQYLAMAGFEVDEMISAMPATLNMATAGNTDLATSADIASNVLSGFGIEASKANNVANVLTKTFTTSNTSLQSIGETMKYVAPSASAVGWSLEEMAGATAKLGDVGIQGSMAGTALRSAVVRLSSPTSEAKALMDKFKISLTDANGQMLPLSEILNSMKDNFSGMTDAQKANATQTIFGTEAMSAMLTLMEDPKGLADYTKGLEVVGNISQEIADKQLDNLSGSVTLLKSAFEGFQISIGQHLTPIIRSLADGLNNLLTWFNNLSPETQKFIAYFLGISSILLLVGGGILLFIGFLPQIIMGFKSLIVVAKALGGAIGFLLSPIGLIILAVVGLIAIIVRLWNTNEGFRNKVIAIWNAIVSKINEAIEFLKPYVMGAFEAIKEFIEVIFDGIKAFWNKWGDHIMKFFEFAFNVVKSIFETVFNIIVTIIKTVFDVIKNIFGLFTAIFTGDWERAWQHIKAIFTSIFDAVGEIFENIFNWFKDLWNNFKEFFGDAWEKFWEGIKDTFGGIIDGIVNFFKDLPKRIKESLNNLVKGIKEKVGKAKEWLSNLNPFKKSSPSLVDNVLAGVDKIKNAYKSIGGMEISVPSIGGLKGGHLQVNRIDGVGDGSGSRDTIYNDALVKVEKMEVRSDDDVRKISNELYNLQRNSERARGR